MRPNGGIIHIQKVIGVGYPHKISKYGVNIDKIYYNELLETLDALLISVSLERPVYSFVGILPEDVVVYVANGTLYRQKADCAERTELAMNQIINPRLYLVTGGDCYYPSETALLERVNVRTPSLVESIGTRPSTGELVAVKEIDGTIYVLWSRLRSATIYKFHDALEPSAVATVTGTYGGNFRNFYVTENGILLVEYNSYIWIAMSDL